MHQKMFRCIGVFVMTLFLTATVQAAQEPGIQLNQSSTSYIYPPFDSDDWTLTRWSNVGAHKGDDYFAQDWARSCGQTRGQNVYASISGTVVVAGWQNGYGNTVIIYDSGARFALRYAHLDSVLVNDGQQVIASETKIGAVGNTGNTSGSCSRDPGAHLHLTLYKNVGSGTGRPITSTRATGNVTNFAADFRYISPMPLVRTNTDPTVYAIEHGLRRPVSWFVFNNRGWNFDRNKSIFNPVQIWPSSRINQYPRGGFCTPRNSTLIKGDSDPTVFFIQNSQKQAVSFEEFACRNFDFRDVITIAQGECDSYPTGNNLQGCNGPPSDTNDAQAKRDFQNVLQRDARFVSLIEGSFARDLNLDQWWEYRWINVRWTNNRQTVSYHITAKHNRSIRYLGFVDPDSQHWTGWLEIR